MDEKRLLSLIERKRRQLDLFLKDNNYNNPQVLKVSKQLDKLINIFERNKQK